MNIVDDTGQNIDIPLTSLLAATMRVRHTGAVMCLSKDCAFNNQQGCWLGGASIVKGVCNNYNNTITFDELFPRMAPEGRKG